MERIVIMGMKTGSISTVSVQSSEDNNIDFEEDSVAKTVVLR